MARVSKGVKLLQDIELNPELEEIFDAVNRINNMIASMGRSEYFRGISIPERMNRYVVIEQAKKNPSITKTYLDAVESSLEEIWNVRRSESAVKSNTGIIYQGGKYIRVLNIAPESSAKRSEKSGRGQLSEKASRMLLADDIEMLKRLTKKSDVQIMKFLNLWYENPDVSGSQLLEKFVDSVYKSEYSGQGASQSWGSPPVRMIIEEKIVETFNIQMDSDEDIDVSWETESKMGKELFDAWMNLFS